MVDLYFTTLCWTYQISEGVSTAEALPRALICGTWRALPLGAWPSCGGPLFDSLRRIAFHLHLAPSSATR
eukprot:scaffold73583_cov62-Phaeocystis_antarctica.AAC.3